jgi:hypothetical protein
MPQDIHMTSTNLNERHQIKLPKTAAHIEEKNHRYQAQSLGKLNSTFEASNLPKAATINCMC